MKKNTQKKLTFLGIAGFAGLLLLALVSAKPLAAPADNPQESLPELFPGEYGLTVDDKIVPLTAPAAFNAANLPYLKLYDMLTVLNCEAEYLGQGLLTVRKAGQPETAVSLDYRWYGNPQQMTADNWKEKYLPFSALGDEFGYRILADEGESWLKVYSPEYPELPPDDPALLAAPLKLPVYGSAQDAPHFAELWPGEEFLTIFYSSILDDLPGRLNNIALACQAMDGFVILPGEVFSYNETVGPRTEERGFQVGRVYLGQVIAPGIGGGICQVSSALHNAVLNSNLQVVERHPHSIKVEYVDPLKDATVAWGELDFRFRNSLDFPITLHSRLVDNRYIVIAFSKN